MACDLYRFYDEQNTLLYVGVSISLLVRLQYHKNSSLWYGAAKRIEIEKFTSREEALAAEKIAIALERPRFNISHNVEIKKEKHPRQKSYGKIPTQQILDYFQVKNLIDLAVLLKCKNKFGYSKLGEFPTFRVFSNMKQKMKKQKIKIPKEWKYPYE